MANETPKQDPRKNGVALATIGIVGGTPMPVHFNPVSLQLSLNNQLKKTNNIQYVAVETLKLTVDLIFDTTDSGEDVTTTTRKIQAFLGPEKPPGESATSGPPPPKVKFEWGTIIFEGVAEAYKETIDFFSSDGVPLRSTVNLTLSRPDRVFNARTAEEGAPGNAAVDAGLFDAPAQSAAALSKNASAPGAARAVAAANQQDSLRFGSGGALTVGGSVELKPAVAFASGSAGLSLGGGAGLSLGGGGGLSLGGSAGISIGGGAGAGFGISGGASLGASGGFGFEVSGNAEAGISASAGIAGLARLSATEGAFSGLRLTTSSASTPRLDPSKLMPRLESAAVSIDAGATFAVGGKASMEGGGGLRANVGASGKLSFDAG
jgi:hypothetical protein